MSVGGQQVLLCRFIVIMLGQPCVYYDFDWAEQGMLGCLFNLHKLDIIREV